MPQTVILGKGKVIAVHRGIEATVSREITLETVLGRDFNLGVKRLTIGQPVGQPAVILFHQPPQRTKIKTPGEVAMGKRISLEEYKKRCDDAGLSHLYKGLVKAVDYVKKKSAEYTKGRGLVEVIDPVTGIKKWLTRWQAFLMKPE